VIDQLGVPVAGIRVSQTWENYTFRLAGGSELITNIEGKATFPKQRRFAPLVYFGFKALANVVGFGAHAGFGTFGRVWIDNESFKGDINRTTEFLAANCSDASCTAAELLSELRLPKQ